MNDFRDFVLSVLIGVTAGLLFFTLRFSFEIHNRVKSLEVGVIPVVDNHGRSMGNVWFDPLLGWKRSGTVDQTTLDFYREKFEAKR